MKKATNIISSDNNKVIDDIANAFTEGKTYTIAFEKCFDTSQEEVSKLTMKLNQFIFDNTRQTELGQELTHKEDIDKIELIHSMQGFQHEFIDSQKFSTSKMNEIEQLLHTLPRISTPLNQNESGEVPTQKYLIWKIHI
ncbi:hypothetical protein O181_055012 [Austropuccinia psidii MF-1]|uniref:Uncharacterized protein n=1 Tax=Austropuccinia psidii MF-1 TaxID=1389203 RepID=A0A9Q3ECT0_9BASI|nr:hypothetical protein [Austropuccinia psidii MF-1]